MNSSDIISYVVVPSALLFSAVLLPSAKIVYMTLKLESLRSPNALPTISKISKETGFARDTVRAAMISLKDGGWLDRDTHQKTHQPNSEKISIPVDLFLDHELTVQSRLLHCMLKSSVYKSKISRLKYAMLSRDLHIDVKTVRKSITQLVRKGWLAISQINQLTPISCLLRNPIREQFDVMLAKAFCRLEKAKWGGESILRELLSAVVDSDDFIDNASPGYLENPETGCLLQIDRLYLKEGIAFEFNGSQHYYPSGEFSAKTVNEQRRRDEIKREICSERSIKLITIHPQDLSVSSILKRIGDLLPLRNLRGGDNLVKFLERRCASYRKNAPVLETPTFHTA